MHTPRHAAGRRPDARKFRPEIEGLRAVAALLVGVYHVWFGKVSGGVDVFFLIAGFLITTSLLGQVERVGRVDVGRFLSRLAKRLLPASLTVLLVVLVATRLWIPVTRESAVYSEIVASALYLENWALAAKSVDYLDRDGASSPVQHFWAMSIQGQFYLIWIAVFAVALWFGRRHVRRSLTALLVALFVVSLTFSVYLTEANQPLAYFHTATRVWEFAAGGLLALAIVRFRRWTELWGAAAGWLGLAMIVVTGVALPVSDAFPGVVALWPLLGAALVLVGSGAQSPLGANRLLSSRPLVYLGGVSYGFYLWHWPLLTFHLQWSGQTTAGFFDGVGVIAVSFVLAVLTTRYVEQPVRSGRVVERVVARLVPLRSWAMPVAGLVSMVVVAGTAVAVDARAGLNEVETAVVVAGDEDHPGAAALLGPDEDDGGYASPPVPELSRATTDRAEVYGNGCHQGLLEPELVACEYGDPTADVTVMLVGGSHSAHWLPALEPVAQARGWRLLSVTKSSCLFSADPPGSGEQRDSSVEWNGALLERIADEAPDLVVTTATRGQGEEEHVPDGYVQVWETLDAAGVPVAALRDTPRFGSSRVDCLAVHGIDSGRCDEPRAQHLAAQSPTSTAEVPGNVSFVDLTHYFCDDETCFAVIGNVVVYFDAHHMTASYARTLAPMLELELAGLLG